MLKFQQTSQKVIFGLFVVEIYQRHPYMSFQPNMTKWNFIEKIFHRDGLKYFLYFVGVDSDYVPSEDDEEFDTTSNAGTFLKFNYTSFICYFCLFRSINISVFAGYLPTQDIVLNGWKISGQFENFQDRKRVCHFWSSN